MVNNKREHSDDLKRAISILETKLGRNA